MQAAYIAAMDEDQIEDQDQRPYRIARRVNLEVLIAEAGGPTQLALLSGTPKTHFSAMTKKTDDGQTKPRAVGDALATKLERVMNKPHGWMDELHQGGAMNGWPLSPELLAALHNADPKQRAFIENTARLALGLELAQMPIQETPGVVA